MSLFDPPFTTLHVSRAALLEGEHQEANPLTLEQRLALVEKRLHALGLAHARHLSEQHNVGPKAHPQEPTRELLQQ